MDNKYIIDKDFHTHTKYSHGKGTIKDNLIAAENKGIKYLGITDHGPRHLGAGIWQSSMKKMRSEIDSFNNSNEFNTKLLLGLELNFISLNGDIDFPKDKDLMDIVICGFHTSALPKNFSYFSKITIPAIFEKISNNSKSQIERNTKTYINAIVQNKIDIISHVNRHIKTNVLDVAKCCEDYGTYLEISTRHQDLTEDEYDQIFNKTNVNIVINSDAHKPENIKRVDKALDVLKTFNVSQKRVANLKNSEFLLRSKNFMTLDKFFDINS